MLKLLIASSINFELNDILISLSELIFIFSSTLPISGLFEEIISSSLVNVSFTVFFSLSDVRRDALSIILNKSSNLHSNSILKSFGIIFEVVGYVPDNNLDKNTIFLYLNNILLLNKCISTLAVSSSNIFVSSSKFLPGTTIFTSFSISLSISTYFLASL